MRIRLTRANERGHSRLDWLESRFSYSFAGYFNPSRMGFGDLRVVNDDIVQPGEGFGAHAHANMEIISIPTFGSLAHKDSTGSDGVVSVGEVQVMSAGSGVEHSEYNASYEEEVRFFQIWIHTQVQNVKPSYDQKNFQFIDNKKTLIVSKNGLEESLKIHQDAKLWWCKYQKHTSFNHKITPGKGLFLMVVEGKISILDDLLEKRDAIEISDTDENILVNIKEDATILLIEVNI